MNALEKYLKRLKFTKIIYILLLTKIALIYTKVCLENWDRGGLPLCGVKVSHQVMLPKALQCLLPRTTTWWEQSGAFSDNGQHGSFASFRQEFDSPKVHKTT